MDQVDPLGGSNWNLLKILENLPFGGHELTQRRCGDFGRGTGLTAGALYGCAAYGREVGKLGETTWG